MGLMGLLSPFDPKFDCICDPIISRGHKFNQFYGEYMSMCLYTPRDLIGVTIGLLNLLVVSTIQLPQIYLNWRRQSCAGLERNMLLLWNLGDISGTLGLILTSQTNTTAFIQQIYCMSIDLILTMQWFWYNYHNKDKNHQENESENENENEKKEQKCDDLKQPLLSSLNTVGRSDDVQFDNDGSMGVSNNNYINNNAVKGGGGGTGGNGAIKVKLYVMILTIIACFYTTSPTTSAASLQQLQSHIFSYIPNNNVYIPNNDQYVNDIIPGHIDTTLLSTSQPIKNDKTSFNFNFEHGNNQTMINLANNTIITDDPEPIYCEGNDDTTQVQKNIGAFFAILCGLIYTPSQWPQILSNYRTKTAHAVSTASLVITMIGYVLYCTALFLPTKYADEHHYGKMWWLSTFPYPASFVCCFMSCAALLGQKWLYQNNNQNEQDGSDVDDNQNNNDITNNNISGSNIPNLMLPSDQTNTIN